MTDARKDRTMSDEALRELHDAIVDYLAQFDYPTSGPTWERLRHASADAAIVLGLDGRFGDPAR